LLAQIGELDLDFAANAPKQTTRCSATRFGDASNLAAMDTVPEDVVALVKMLRD
jgi:hypothetical protein